MPPKRGMEEKKKEMMTVTLGYCYMADHTPNSEAPKQVTLVIPVGSTCRQLKTRFLLEHAHLRKYDLSIVHVGRTGEIRCVEQVTQTQYHYMLMERLLTDAAFVLVTGERVSIVDRVMKNWAHNMMCGCRDVTLRIPAYQLPCSVVGVDALWSSTIFMEIANRITLEANGEPGEMINSFTRYGCGSEPVILRSQSFQRYDILAINTDGNTLRIPFHVNTIPGHMYQFCHAIIDAVNMYRDGGLPDNLVRIVWDYWVEHGVKDYLFPDHMWTDRTNTAVITREVESFLHKTVPKDSGTKRQKLIVDP